MATQSNLQGVVIGRLTVLDQAPSRRSKVGTSYVYWNCICECGVHVEVKSVSLTNPKRPTKSCGCLQREASAKTGKSNYLGKDVAGTNSLFNIYKRGARHRGFEFELSKEYFTKLIDGNCFYCGDPPKQVWRRSEVVTTRIYTGIDRVDSLKGYTTDNVVSCCYNCNIGKMDYTAPEFFEMVRKIYERHLK